MNSPSRLLKILAAGTAATMALASASVEAADVDWRYYGNDLLNRRFQDVDQITPANVAKLKPAWVFHTGEIKMKESFEASPIIVDRTVYVSTGMNTVFALDAATGKKKWVYKPKFLAPPPKLPLCCGMNNRGVAYGDGKIFLARLDAVLVALDAKTGKEVWHAQVADWQRGYSMTIAPQFYDGKVIVGTSGGEYAIKGKVAAYDAATGKLAWKFDTIKPDTWAGNSSENGGVPVWGNPSVDPQLGLVYVGTGNASPDFNGSNRAGLNLYASSVVALDARTGQPRWHFQEIHHDIWDYDGPMPPMLFDMNVNGQTVPAVGHCTKGGQYFILDRRNGQPIYPVEEVPVPQEPAWQHPWPTQPMSAVEPLTPIGLQDPPQKYGYDYAPYFTPPTVVAKVMQPGTEAGCEWPPAAFSPRTGYIYYVARYEPTGFVGQPGPIKGPNNTEKDPGSAFDRPLSGIDYWGYFGATDTRTGRIAWKHKVGADPLTGPAVVGDLVFYGETDGTARAADARTGKILWTMNMPKAVKGAGGANGAWSAYQVDDREYVISVFGGSAPERHLNEPSPVGDAIVAFALPKE